MRKIYFIFTFCIAQLFGLSSMAQMSLMEIEASRVTEKQVLNYLKTQQKLNIHLFQDFHPSWDGSQDSAEYCNYKRVYLVKESIEKVWDTYANTSPSVSWKSKKSTLGLLYNREKDEILYTQDSMPAPKNGHLMFLNLRLVKGLYRMATAFEITKVSKEENTIEISYIQTGVARGKQSIKLEETSKGFTKITHTSLIQSDSRFRDKVVYPYFHNKLINAFHRNMKRITLSNDERLADI